MIRRALARRAGVIGIAAGLVVACTVQLVPFYITLTTALKPRTELTSQWLLPTHGIYWQNFQTAMADGGILRAMGNSAIVTVASTVLVCLLGALAAYPLARRPTRGNRLVLAGIVALIMIPPLSVLVPVYTLMARLGWINTYWGAVALMVASQLPLSVFLYASFIRSLPVSIEEAATVDGAGVLQVLFRVVFPMLRPVTATVIILTSVAVWNEYALSVFVLRDPAVRTTAPAIGTFVASQGSDPGAAAAAAVLTVIPVLVAYFVLQRYFIKGMVAGAER